MENLENTEQQKLKVEKNDDGDIFFISGLDEDSLFQLGFLICQNLDKSINQYLFKKDYFLSGESIRPGGCFALTYDKHKKRIFLDNRNARGDEKIREKLEKAVNGAINEYNTTLITQ